VTVHDYHEGQPGYSPDQILHDGIELRLCILEAGIKRLAEAVAGLTAGLEVAASASVKAMTAPKDEM
jgi:hypothetical protein